MARKNKTIKSADTSVKPKVFIGSTSEAATANIVAGIELNLRHGFEVAPWTAGIFEPGDSPLASLERQLDKTSFGIFVFSPDDITVSRGKRNASPRDNVIFEAGLFMGKLGSQRCFVIVPKNWAQLKMPSDLQGFNLADYDLDRLEKDGAQQALSAACNSIRLAIQRRISEERPAQDVTMPSQLATTENEPNSRKESSDSEAMSVVQKHLVDLLEMAQTGRAGFKVQIQDASVLRTWSRTLLKMAFETIKRVTSDLPDDTYVAWLKPTQKNLNILNVFEGENLPADYADHYKFYSGEGLAGTIWSQGQSAVHSPKKPHPAWKTRAGCANASYVGVPVGSPNGQGGILTMGSNKGFDVSNNQVEALTAYASILGLAGNVSATTNARSAVSKRKNKSTAKRKAK